MFARKKQTTTVIAVHETDNKTGGSGIAMISDAEIETKAAEFQLRPLDVQKDYVYSWLLKGLFQRPALAAQLVLKGGNALRKGYLPDTSLL